jgi:hypothetical protein
LADDQVVRHRSNVDPERNGGGPAIGVALALAEVARLSVSGTAASECEKARFHFRLQKSA